MGVIGGQAIGRAGVGAPAARGQGAKRHLFGPAADFLLLGGVSLVLFPFAFVLPAAELAPSLAAAALFAANFINHPHFAYSYQIFYAGFRDKAFGRNSRPLLRARYIFAGIAVPLALGGFLLTALALGDATLLGRGGNLMAFLVGWHYVKQGYGMLMVDAALKRLYFDAPEKTVLRLNGYAVWLLAWLSMNDALATRSMHGIEYYMFDVPAPVLGAAAFVALATTALAMAVLVLRWRANGGGLPLAGVTAYVVSLYLWVLMVRWNVLWFLVVPVLHSLQYLVVVARFRLNRERGRADSAENPGHAALARLFRRRAGARFAGFALFGVLLGYLGFWGVPQFLQAAVGHDPALGAAAFLFVFWIFINVHHYFLDNVVWRSENPDVGKYLFS